MARHKNRSKTKLAGLTQSGGTVFGNPLGIGNGSAKGAGGYGVSEKGAKVATGTSPTVNPFIIPKQAGLTNVSQVYPSYYYVSWDITRWRYACDQAIKQGYCTSIATLYSWAFESSPFIQGLFNKLGRALDKIPFHILGANGDELPELTEEMCNKPWQLQLRREILFSYFWGFSGINIDPINGKIYKYPMQNIDPINRMLKSNTFAFYDGELFADYANLLFIQPSTSYESFLGWMQPIAREFIQMNTSSNNWIAAGRRLAFPVMTVGYPQDDGSIDPVTGKPMNNYRDDAVNIATNMDPQQAQVYPYTVDPDGNIVKSVMIEFEKPGTAANMHKIFQEFNADQKSEIEQMIFGRAFTNATSKGGNRALGEVEEEAVIATIEGLLPFVLATLNDDQEFKAKISSFYTGLPANWKYGCNTSRMFSPEQIKSYSDSVTANGLRLTPKFFEDNGLAPEYLTEAPVPVPTNNFGNNDDEPALQMAGLKKKFF